MKKLSFITLFLLPLSVFSQKSVDLDRFRFSVQLRNLPEMKLDSSYRTYHVEVDGTKLMQPFLQHLSPEKTVLLEGWKKLPANGHLSINVKLGDLLPESVSVKERSVVVKNKSGQVTGTKNFYYQEVIYSFEAEAKISDYRGRHIMDQQLTNRNSKRTYRSPEFALRAMAEGYFVINSLAVTKDLYQDCVERAMHTLSNRITRNFGFEEATARDFMWIIDSRKHPEYTAWRKTFSIMNEVLFSMNAYTPIEGTREQLKPVIDYYEKIKKEYTSNKRHDRKIRYGCYYNLAVLYYYLDDPQAMMKEANGLMLNDYDANDGKGLEKTAIWLKSIFQQTNIYTRHFPIDPSVFKGPYEQSDVTIN